MAEIERAVDEQMNQLRAQVLQDAAHQSPTQQEPSSSTPQLECPDCHVPLQARGHRKQGVVQAHRADAVRILDFAHAASRVAAIGEQVRLLGRSLPLDWLEKMLHRLKHEGARRVLPDLEKLSGQAGAPEVMGEHVRYLCKRVAQMNYPHFQACGYPIGSGMVESGNKLVMQARLKGAGMHWELSNVNPMLALRMNLCNERWEEGWQDQQRWQQTSREARRRNRQQQRRVHKQEHAALLRALLAPPVIPVTQEVSKPKPRTERTEAQRQWGRRTFICRIADVVRVPFF